MSGFPLWCFSEVWFSVVTGQISWTVESSKHLTPFNLGCEPAASFNASFFCLDPESLTAIQESVVMAMVDTSEAHGSCKVRELTTHKSQMQKNISQFNESVNFTQQWQRKRNNSRRPDHLWGNNDNIQLCLTHSASLKIWFLVNYTKLWENNLVPFLWGLTNRFSDMGFESDGDSHAEAGQTT